MAHKRPATGTCAHCKRTLEIGPIGRVPKYCRPACRTAAYDQAKRGGRPSAEERQRRVIWGVLQDAGIIPTDKPLPMRKAEDAAW